MIRLGESLTLGRLLPKLVSTARRGLSAAEEVTEGKYVLKIDMAPFKKNDVTVKTDQGVVTLSGRREKKGASSWTHEVHMVFALPDTITPGTLQTSFLDDGVLVVSGQTKS